MLAPELVERIRGFLAEGRMSRRGIARALKVSRGSVNAIASGRRRDYASGGPTPWAGPDPPSGPEERCPGCGAMVQMPCLACRVRALRERGKRSP